MKKLVLAAVVVLIAAVVTSQPNQIRNSVFLAWDYDTNSVPDAFKLYTSDDISKPPTNWSLIATVSGNIHNISLTNMLPQQAWFFVTASNWWGESDPSNIAGLPQPPSTPYNLQIAPLRASLSQ